MLLPTHPASTAIKQSRPYAVGELVARDGEDSYDYSGLQTYAIGAKPHIYTAVYTYNGQTTYTNSDCTFKWSVPNTTDLVILRRMLLKKLTNERVAF